MAKQVKNLNKPLVNGGKKGADNMNQRKLTEARDVLAGRYSKLPVRDKDGKATKVTMSWIDIFDQASGDAQDAYEAFKGAKEAYSEESKSISQLFMEVARVAGSLEQFRTDYKNMLFVWKTTNNVKAAPQSIYDAASVIKRSFKAGIDVKKASGIQALKDAIREKNKEEKEDTVATETVNPAIANTMKLLTRVAVLLEQENMLEELSQFLKGLEDVTKQYVETETTEEQEADILSQVIEQDVAKAAQAASH